MSTPTAAPPAVTSPAADGTTSPRRRRRWPLFVALALFDVVAILAVAFIANYQPLLPGSETGISVEVKRIEGFSPPDAWVVPYVEGQTFVFAVSIRNDGPLGVTVTSVGREDPTFESLMMYDGAFIGASEEPGLPTYDLRELSPLRPFALAPGHERLVWIRYRFDNCRSFGFGGASGVTSLPVSFRLFGIPRHGDVHTNTVVEVKSPKDCPGRPETP